MKRRQFLGMVAVLPLVPVATPAGGAANRIPITELNRYLNSLKTAQGTFVQINPDHTRSRGIFYLSRPGRMRFEYAPPDSALVVAGQGRLAIFDGKSNQGPQQYPLNRTPLYILLKRVVNLGRSGMITAHQSEGNATSITARNPEYPDQGQVTLVFSAAPTTLRQWVVTDQSGHSTTVTLGPLATGGRLPAALFDIDRMVREDTGTER
ncbi:MAG: outer membrane lipoprotein carrier protein LolA [Rhodobacteraceae bacterium]|nr:outer membrane lipoprotein carrier protein LolA [Paracoccaceae bacterium]